ncbi:hypothetical protein QCI42_21685 [Bacillus fungorum]|uniref:hypothetical protein n=1 Tax=Bacillus fungorum TaxID=2039284 RepID=UPI003393CE48
MRLVFDRNDRRFKFDLHEYFDGNSNQQPDYSNGISQFLRRISSGICLMIQYISNSPSSGIYQGGQNGTVLLSNFNGLLGITWIAINEIHAVSLNPSGCRDCCSRQEQHDCQEEFLYHKECEPRYRDVNVYEEDKNFN